MYKTIFTDAQFNLIGLQVFLKHLMICESLFMWILHKLDIEVGPGWHSRNRGKKT